jgi:hypothetical protein
MAPLGLDKRPANSPAEVAALNTVASSRSDATDAPVPKLAGPQIVPTATAREASNGSANHFIFSDYTAPGGFMAIDPSAREAVLSQARSASSVRILCRTDRSRPSKAARATALRRGAAVRRFLISQGVPPQNVRLYVRSCGAFVADNATLIGKAKNRRVEILFS